MPATSSRSRGGRPARTSRAQILAAAQLLIERDGWRQLTMRRLAAEIGVATTTLYHHVRDRDDLLIQLLEEQAAALPRPPLAGRPRERVIAAAVVMHDALAARPWIAEILTADDLLGDSALWIVEAIVTTALDAGAAPERAVGLYRTIWYYTVGEVLVRAHAGQRRADEGRPVHREELMRNLDPGRLPGLAGLGHRWSELTARDTYLDGLQVIVDGLLPGASRGTE